MPRNTTITLPAKQWTRVTASDVSVVGLRINNLSFNPVLLQGTVGAVPPAVAPPDATLAPVLLTPIDGYIDTRQTMAILFGGIVGVTRAAKQ